MKDAYDKGRLCVPDSHRWQKGSVPPNRRLDDDEARKVKRLINNRSVTLKELAKELDLPHQLLRDISCGRSYVNI